VPKSKKQIISEISEYIERKGGAESDWYVDVADRANEALSRVHGLGDPDDVWIYRTATSARVAHAVRDFFTGEFGTDGGREARPATHRKVYAYRKRPHTDP
jgi:hypothetical protein